LVEAEIPMIAPERIAEIRRLLSEGAHSQRAIARLTGISRGTVTAVANGRRPDYVPRPKADATSPLRRGPCRRCRRCGALVYMPCRACAIRTRLDREAKPRRVGREPEIVLGLDLRPEHRRRYEAIRARRERAGEFLAQNGAHER
jgi:hypothetical protein